MKGIKEMKFVFRICIVNRGNRKNIYGRNDVIICIRSYFDFEDIGKLFFWFLEFILDYVEIGL